MQMLESFLGPQFARFAGFLVIAVALLILILVVWWLIKKTMGDRLNMSDKPDRRGRPPRLGITESFAVDRQGRRLVMVRRDNVEHLVMIGGPNDVVIETNVVRGERPVVGRPDVRPVEPELVFAPAQVDVAPPIPVAATAPAPKPIVAAQPAPPPPPTQVQAPVTDLPKPVVAERRMVEPTSTVASPSVGTSFADKLKAGVALGSSIIDKVKANEASKIEEAKAAEVIPTVEVKPTPVMVPSPAPVKVAPPPAPPVAAPSVAMSAPRPAPPPPPPPPAPPPPPPPPPQAPKAPAPMVEPEKLSASAARPVSKNPFDSLEVEMAKLLGRAPDGKG